MCETPQCKVEPPLTSTPAAIAENPKLPFVFLHFLSNQTGEISRKEENPASMNGNPQRKETRIIEKGSPKPASIAQTYNFLSFSSTLSATKQE